MINGRNKGAQERWVDVTKPFTFRKGMYQISSKGSIRNKLGLMKLNSDDRGYLQCCLMCIDSMPHTIKVARLVMLHFVGGRAKCMTIDHKDENKENNEVSNLRYISRSENSSRNKGTHKFKGAWLSLRAIHDKYGLPELKFSSVKRRYDRGWNIEEAITTPLLRTGQARGQV